MFDFLFFATWLLSIVCVAVISYSLGYGKANKDRNEGNKQIKDNALEFLEGLKCLKKSSSD